MRIALFPAFPAQLALGYDISKRKKPPRRSSLPDGEIPIRRPVRPLLSACLFEENRH